jgi:hypothetical protein
LTGGLSLLVADVLAVEPDGEAGVVVLEDLHAAWCGLARSTPGRGAESGDRHRLPSRHQLPYAVAELVGYLGQWMSDPAAEPLAHRYDGHAQEGRAGGSGLVVPSGSLPDLLRAALAPLRPALDVSDAEDA